MPRRSKLLERAAPPTPEVDRAVTSLEMVNVLSSAYEHVSMRPSRLAKCKTGRGDLKARLTVEAWVRNVAYQKDVWLEAVLVDADGETPVRTERIDLTCWGPAPGGGDFFGTVQLLPSPGPFPDGRRVDYRLYYAVNEEVFTDGVLHQHPLPPPGM
jgi:hypothetical protein